MANELNLRLSPSATGLTIVARLRQPGGAQQGSDISCPENGSVAGFYSGNMPGSVPANVYTVDFFDTAGSRLMGVGELHWSGTEELTVEDTVEDIATLSAAVPGMVQSGMTVQGYTTTRATKLDNLDNLNATISSVLAAIAALDDLSAAQVQTAVQAALTAQGYTTTRATKLDNLDNLDAAITSVLSAITGLDDISIVDVQTALTNQGYTSGRAAFLDHLPTILASVERIRKISGNKVVVSVDELTVTVYEDNGTTVAFQFSISADKLTRTPI